MCKGAAIVCRGVCSQCVTCMCLCACAVFQNLVCIHVDNYNFMEIFFPPFLTTTSAAEANSRGRVEAKRSGSLSLSFSLSLSLSFLSFSLSLSTPPSFCRSSSSVARTTYVSSLGWTQNHCYQCKCTQTSHNDFHLEPVHKHSQMHIDTLSGLRQAGCMLFSSTEAAVT